jgi:uncharacterized repeat protein (TIGR03803 family)
VLKDLTWNDGGAPEGGLILSGTTLYGVASAGGQLGFGTIFKMDTDGSNYVVLKNFAGTDGKSPQGRLLLEGTTLYGTTEYGGNADRGTVFKINADGSGFTVLKEFSWDDGAYPRSGLAMSGSTLYGTTWDSDTQYFSSIFSVETNGNNFATIKEASVWMLGSRPRGALLCDGQILYGTMGTAPGLNEGTLFKMNCDGSGATVLHAFPWSNGACPDGAFPDATLLLSNSTLYGTASVGGSGENGTVFEIDTNGGNFTVLKSFTGDDGSYAFYGLVLADANLYGVTYQGGNLGSGVLFKLSLLPATSTIPEGRSAETGTSISVTVDFAGAPPLTYQWFFNVTNLIACGTNDWLELTNCDFSQSGTYTIVVTNIFGAATSAPVMLNVIPAVERRPVPGVRLMGEIGSSLNVEYADSLGPKPNWLPLDSVNLTNPPQYCFDSTVPLSPQRFYRTWEIGTPGVAPSLNLNFVPAITLNGNIGDKLRLDCINQIGPTDAWVTLDTVTLTNTSQLYFDTSAVGQPVRLYRIVPVP